MRKILFACLMMVGILGSIDACTGIMRQAKNGDWVYARTMEFGSDFVTFDLAYVPRGFEYTAHTPTGAAGQKWTTKYAYVGFSPFGMNLVADGLNERGLACGGFWFAGWAGFQKFTPEEASKTISNIDFISWVLSNFSRVEEVRKALKDVTVVGVELAPIGPIPVHYAIVDETGDRAIVEYVDGQLHLYDASLGVMTNSPDYAWHTTNARNYIGLQALNRPAVKIGDAELASFGQGSGAIGLPGDFTSPSRFIRAGFLRAVAYPGKDAQEELSNTFRILNQFDIPRGAVRGTVNGKEVAEITQWTSASDLKGRRYLFHTEYNRDIRVVDLSQLNPEAKEVAIIPINQPGQFQDISQSLKKS